MIRFAQIYPQPHVGRIAACLFPEMQADLYSSTSGYTSGAWNHTVPYGTDPILHESQAINCLANDHSVPGQVQPGYLFKK
jgi:hypothetical protein